MNIKKSLKKILPVNFITLIGRIKCVFLFPIRHINVCFNYIFHNRDQFKYNLSIAAMVKNEENYIKEWIDYHKLAGVDKFIIYDNNSTDNTKNILQPYIESGIVDYYFYPKTQADFIKKNKKAEYWAFQAYAYNQIIKKYRNTSKWIGFIDIDEFLLPVKESNILNVINEVKSVMGKKPFVGLAVNWVMYGFCSHFEKPKGLIIKNFTRNDGIHEGYKSIVNPRTVIKYYVHSATHFFNIEVVNEQGIDSFLCNISKSSIEKIRINHYYTKSYEEYTKKIIKSREGWPGADKYNLPEYDPDYLSHNEDSIINRFIPLLQ